MPNSVVDRIQREFRFLVEDFGFSESESRFESGGFGDGDVLYESSNVLIRVVCDRSQFSADLSPSDETDWFDLELVLGAIADRKPEVFPGAVTEDIRDLASLLRNHLPQVLRAFHPSEFPETESALRELQKKRMEAFSR